LQGDLKDAPRENMKRRHENLSESASLYARN
jgi:hypothetical protein